LQKKYTEFLRNFRADSTFKYRESLLQHYRRGDSTIVVDLAELALFDRELLALLQKWPDDQLKMFEAAASDALQRELLPNPEAAISCGNGFDVQIALKSTQIATPLRNLTAEHIGKLIKVSGIIVSMSIGARIQILHCFTSLGDTGASRVKSKAVGVQIRCTLAFYLTLMLASDVPAVENAISWSVAAPSRKLLSQHDATASVVPIVVHPHT